MFNLGDKRLTYIIMAIFILMNISRYVNSPESLVTLILTLPAVLVAITFHEFAHAFAADKLGDDTPRRQGRLTLNPIAHLDPVGSIMLIFAGFGWGKPVEIEPRNFNRDRSMSSSEAIVAFAGPAMNFILAIVFAIILGIVLKLNPSALMTVTIGGNNTAITIILQLLVSCIAINLGLGIFNLIPLPPLDGSKILRNFLPYKAKQWYDMNYQILYIVFLLIWITPIASTLISPVISAANEGLLDLVFLIFKITL